jgi:dolichol-phosphate mannosyltransferase
MWNSLKLYALDKSRTALLWWQLPLSRRWVGGYVILLGVMLGLRLLAMVAVPLIPEEAYYWMYAQHPALSYFDHPPMVAWVIGFGSAVFGDTELGVRVVGNLMMLGASWLMYLFGRAWFSRPAGVVSALMLQVLPVYFGVGFIATMDAALVFFWLLCLVGVTAALRGGRVWGWYVAGFALGSALLSKYTGIFLAVGTGLAVLAHRPWRRHLLTPHPYLAFLCAAALFSPVVIWNVQHDWASFRFQFLERFGHELVNPRRVLDFAGFQLLIATPVILWGCYRLIARQVQNLGRVPAPRFIITYAFSLPLLLVMAYKALRYSVHLNWTVPAYLTLLPAVSQWIIVHMRQRFRDSERRLWTRRLAWTLVCCVLVNIALTVYLLVLQPRVQWPSVFGPWQQLALVVEEYEDQCERESGREPLIVANGEYRLASILAFYRRRLEHDVDASHYTTSQWLFGGNGLGYPYWAEVDHWRGRDCVYIDDGEIPIANLQHHFDNVLLVSDARLPTTGRHHWHLAIGRRLH